LQSAVTTTDQQIEALVDELHGLSPEEIALVEGISSTLWPENESSTH
jgi:hypothetical protein